MFKFIVDWFGKKPHPNAEAPAATPEAAPYKIEAPQVAVVAEAQPVAQEPAKTSKPRRKPAAKKAPAAAMTATKKPRSKKTS